jgi:hypothetical protein
MFSQLRGSGQCEYLTVIAAAGVAAISGST